MANETAEIALSKQDLREVTGDAAECAQGVLEIFESIQPTDSRLNRALILDPSHGTDPCPPEGHSTSKSVSHVA